jgi:hypothetical protein
MPFNLLTLTSARGPTRERWGRSPSSHAVLVLTCSPLPPYKQRLVEAAAEIVRAARVSATGNLTTSPDNPSTRLRSLFAAETPHTERCALWNFWKPYRNLMLSF